MVRTDARPPGRARMIAVAAGLLGRRGVERTSFARVVSESRAPRGSIYYYFPSGKRQLVTEAVRWTTRVVLDHQRSCRARTPAGVIAHFVRFFRRALGSTGCRTGCPLAAVAVGASAPVELLRRSVRAGFAAWTGVLERQLRSTGVPKPNAHRLAVVTLAAVEGALLLARAEGSIAPLDAVALQLRAWAAPPRRRAARRAPG